MCGGDGGGCGGGGGDSGAGGGDGDGGYKSGDGDDDDEVLQTFSLELFSSNL